MSNKLTAIISDVHGNYEALKAVFADIDKKRIERVVSLGDVVGYGPFPVECHRMVQERAEVRLLGNHEYAILTGPRNFNPIAAEAIYWTQKKLNDTEILADIRTHKSAHLDGSSLYVHGSVDNPVFDYVPEIDSNAKYREMMNTLTKEFKRFDTCFVGHNHRPFLCTMDGSLYPHDQNARFNIAGQKLYVSVGSVGQPRDRDPRACYVTIDDERVITYHRIAYNVQKTANAVVRRGLPPYLGKRLLEGR